MTPLTASTFCCTAATRPISDGWDWQNSISRLSTGLRRIRAACRGCFAMQLARPTRRMWGPLQERAGRPQCRQPTHRLTAQPAAQPRGRGQAALPSARPQPRPRGARGCAWCRGWRGMELSGQAAPCHVASAKGLQALWHGSQPLGWGIYPHAHPSTRHQAASAPTHA
jgi:hypothetical protein